MTVRLGKGEDIYELLKVASLNGLLGEYSNVVESIETAVNVGFPHGASGADVMIPGVYAEFGGTSSPHSIGGADVWIPAHWLEFGAGISPHSISGADVYSQSPLVAGSASTPHGASGADVYYSFADTLTITELDGAPVVRDVKQIVFDNGTVTDNGNGIARVTNGGGGSYASIVATIALTDQAADISSTPISGTNTAGTYRVNYYMVTTISDGVTSLYIDFSWVDVSGETQVLSTVNLLAPVGISFAVPGDLCQFTFPLQVASGSISYSVTANGAYNDSTYALYITCEKLS